MKPKQRASLDAVGRRSRWEADPDAITRPDTVPAALRFAEDSVSSSIVDRSGRELVPYPRVPDLPPLDEPTVVDAALARAATPLRHISGERPIADPRRAEPPRSGPEQRLASTVPPPSRTRSKRPARLNAEDAPARSHARASSVRPSGDLPAAAPRMPGERQAALARARRRSPLVTAALVLFTVVLAAAFGSALGNGSFAVFGGSTRASSPELGSAAAPFVGTLAERLKDAALVPAPAPKPAAEPAAPAPSSPPTATDVPVVRYEDLPRAEANETATGAKPKAVKQRYRTPRTAAAKRR